MAAEGFQFEGVKYEMGTLMLGEARAIQRATGLTIMEWEKRIAEGDADAITALIWIARKRNGEPNLRFDDVDGDLGTFGPLDDAEPEPEPGEEGHSVPPVEPGAPGTPLPVYGRYGEEG